MSTDIRLFDLLNLSIGAPEAGFVNFRALRTFLHAILSRLSIQDATAQWSEEDMEHRGNSFTKQQFSSTPEVRLYHQLEDNLQYTENRLAALENLPNGSDLIDCTNTSSSPVNDMWQAMQLRRKVEANQDGVSKSMALIQDLMREISDLRASKSSLQEEVYSLQAQLSQLNVKELLDKCETLEQCCHQVEDFGKSLRELQEKLNRYPDSEEFTQIITWDVLQDVLVNDQQVLNVTSTSPDEDRLSPHPQQPHSDGAVLSPFELIAEHYPETVSTLRHMGQLRHNHGVLEERVTKLETDKADRSELQLMRESFSNMMMQNVSEDLLQQLNHMKDRVESISAEREKNSDLMGDVKGTVLQLEAECKRLNNTTSRLVEDHAEKQKHVDLLYNSLKHLDEQKADKELVEMKIDIKADKRALETKVSRTQFDTMTEQLSSMLQDLLSKVTGQEQDWHSVVEKISTEMENKLNRIELDPLKRQLEDRWKVIRTQLQSQPSPELNDAAGIRKQLVARFHCISCDRPLDMVTPGPQLITIPSAPSLPSHRSGRPYSVYDLRQHSRGERVPEIADCCYLPVPRSCGGSHTLTLRHRRGAPPQYAPQQYAPQPAQVLDEAQPVPGPVQSEEVGILGLDGHVYKGRLNMRAVKNKELKLPSISPEEGSLGGSMAEPQFQRIRPAKSSSRTMARPHSARTMRRQLPSSCFARDRPSSSFGRLSQGTASPSSSPEDTNGELQQKLEIHLDLLQTSQVDVIGEKCT